MNAVHAIIPLLLTGCLVVNTEGAPPTFAGVGMQYMCSIDDGEPVATCIDPLAFDAYLDATYAECGCVLWCEPTDIPCVLGGKP